MPKRVPLQSIVVYRPVGFPDRVAKGEERTEAYAPPVGKPFDFTKEEVDDVMQRNPAAMTAEATVDLSTEEGRQLASAASASAAAAKAGTVGAPTQVKTGGKSTDDV